MRIGYSEDEDYGGQFELWQANCRRSLQGKAGQTALRELEAALIALPDKRLIAGKLIDAEGEVCAIGALAKYKGRDLINETRQQLAEIGIERDVEEIEGDGEIEEIGIELGMPRLVAWKVVELNDIHLEGSTLVTNEGPYRWPAERPKEWVPITPEARYEQVLAWVRRQLSKTKFSG
ncbi:MAG TPA: hypothetical protein VFX97_17070 [Pyrinomonadaceae bacterium]|nr:hypothetical protein [Pyrinomonadaceae bacterium]